METRDVTKLSVQELKALAYETLTKINLEQRNLQTLENEIAKKQVEKPVETAEPESLTVEQPTE